MPKGYPNIPLPTFEDRFWSRVDKQFLGCWEWTKPRDRGGYGVASERWYGTRQAHRIAYIMMKGAIPKGLQLDHLCRNRACVNPNHLEPVTQRENLLRGDTFLAPNLAKTHCLRGHPLIASNLVPAQLKRGKRACAQCAEIRLLKYKDPTWRRVPRCP